MSSSPYQSEQLFWDTTEDSAEDFGFKPQVWHQEESAWLKSYASQANKLKLNHEIDKQGQ